MGSLAYNQKVLGSNPAGGKIHFGKFYFCNTNSPCAHVHHSDTFSRENPLTQGRMVRVHYDYSCIFDSGAQ